MPLLGRHDIDVLAPLLPFSERVREFDAHFGGLYERVMIAVQDTRHQPTLGAEYLSERGNLTAEGNIHYTNPPRISQTILHYQLQHLHTAN